MATSPRGSPSPALGAAPGPASQAGGGGGLCTYTGLGLSWPRAEWAPCWVGPVLGGPHAVSGSFATILNSLACDYVLPGEGQRDSGASWEQRRCPLGQVYPFHVDCSWTHSVGGQPDPKQGKVTVPILHPARGCDDAQGPHPLQPGRGRHAERCNKQDARERICLLPPVIPGGSREPSARGRAMIPERARRGAAG